MESEAVNANVRNHDHERGLPRLGGKPASYKIVIAIFISAVWPPIHQ